MRRVGALLWLWAPSALCSPCCQRFHFYCWRRFASLGLRSASTSGFLGTKLYKENLEGYVSDQGMTRAAKVRIMAVVTVLMSIGFALMHQVPVGRIILVCVWVFHLAYFTLGVKERRA